LAIEQVLFDMLYPLAKEQVLLDNSHPLAIEQVFQENFASDGNRAGVF